MAGTPTAILRGLDSTSRTTESCFSEDLSQGRGEGGHNLIFFSKIPPAAAWRLDCSPSPHTRQEAPTVAIIQQARHGPVLSQRAEMLSVTMQGTNKGGVCSLLCIPAFSQPERVVSQHLPSHRKAPKTQWEPSN